MLDTRLALDGASSHTTSDTRGAVGKRTLTAQLSPRPPAGAGSAGGASPSGALDPAVAARAGAALGHDLSTVKVESDGQAEALGTRAFARGDQLHFARGAYDPSTAEGVKLIGHELGHVVQQREGRVAATGSRGGMAVNTDAGLEAAADAAGERVAQGFDLDGFLDFGGPRAAAAPTAGGAPVIQGEDLAAEPAPASRTVAGAGGYQYEQFANGDVTIVGGPKKVGTTYAAGTEINLAITREIEATHGPFPSAPAAAEPAPAAAPAAGAGDGGLLPSLDEIIAEAAALADDAVAAGQAVADEGVALLSTLKGVVWQTLGLGGGEASPAAPAPAAPAPAAPAAPAADGTAVDANLAAAERLADELSIPHGYDHDGKGKNGANETVIADPLETDARREAIVAGDASQMKTILCSEFTNLVLAQSGVDLNQRYLVPDERLPLAYADKHGTTFVTLYMVTNFQPEATAAVLAFQHGTAEKIEPGSERATELGHDEAFYYSTATTFVGGELGAGDEFGAGATAVSLGGKEVDPADRRPGDLQQSATVAGGKAVGSGHSSQVWSVRGPGVAFLGAPGSPKVIGTVKSPGPIESLSGWYRIAPGGALAWELVPETDPAQVASLTCESYQLIEANTNNKGDSDDDATDVSGKRTDASDQVVSDGRLPDSKWIAWVASEPELAGTLG